MYGLGKNYNSGAFISIDNYIGIEDYRSIYFIYLLIKGFFIYQLQPHSSWEWDGHSRKFEQTFIDEISSPMDRSSFEVIGICLFKYNHDEYIYIHIYMYVFIYFIDLFIYI